MHCIRPKFKRPNIKEILRVVDHGGIREGATSGPTSNEPCASPTIYHLIVKSYQLLVKWPLSCAILHCSRSAGKRKWHLRMRAVNLIFLSCKIIINKNIVIRNGFIEGRFYLWWNRRPREWTVWSCWNILRMRRFWNRWNDFMHKTVVAGAAGPPDPWYPPYPFSTTAAVLK